ncbi:MAG: hypothetical protein IKR36_08420 [Clostridia bacterium]|nr:hypothetical protein [Clostridia bacterium]
MMKRFLIIILAMLITIQCAFAQSVPDAEAEDREAEILASLMDGEEPFEIHKAADMEEKTAISLTEFVKRFASDETGEYTAFNGEAWGLLYEDSSVKEEASEKNVMTSENGDIFATPDQKFCIAEQTELVFDTEYAFAKESGLYGVNVRFVFQKVTDEFIVESLTMLISGFADAFGAVDSMGKEIPEGFEGIDIHNYKERYIYLGENDTFLRLNLRSFQNAVILDVDTGLVSAFPKL